MGAAGSLMPPPGGISIDRDEPAAAIPTTPLACRVLTRAHRPHRGPPAEAERALEALFLRDELLN